MDKEKLEKFCQEDFCTVLSSDIETVLKTLQDVLKRDLDAVLESRVKQAIKILTEILN